jgi:hypothetical protein
MLTSLAATGAVAANRSDAVLLAYNVFSLADSFTKK